MQSEAFNPKHTTQRAVLITLSTINRLNMRFILGVGSRATKLFTLVALSYSLSLRSNKIQIGKMSENRLMKCKECTTSHLCAESSSDREQVT